jgi:predicted DCC family thiol-disulfide oxidoreductase YuxK
MNQNQEVKNAIDLQEILKKQPILLFDGECGFCNKSVSFFLKREDPKRKRAHFAPLQSEIGRTLRAYFEIDKDLDSIILIKDHSAFIKSCAALRMTRYMRGLWPLLLIFLLIPPFLRNPIYDLVAKRRQKIAGRVPNCELLKEEDQTRFL